MSKFLDRMIERAKQEKKTIVLAEGAELRTIAATEMLLKQGVANVVLLGNQEEIKTLAKGHDIVGAQIIDPEKADNFEDFVATFYEMRKAKGITMEQARETMKNTLYYGSMMVKKDLADGMVAGAVNATADVLRPNLQILKTAPGIKMVSAFFVMIVPDYEFGADGAFIFADAGLIENPSADEVSEIALSSAKSFEMLVEQEPIVGMISYSTYGSAHSDLVTKMQEATKLAQQKAPHVKLDGEFQIDAAIVPEIGAAKAPGSEVAGKCNVLVFPDLNCGNSAYKLVQRLAKAEAYGPITQGIAKPVNDLSRGCSAEDIVGVVAITCVQAQHQK